jgi:hypothetical protein
LCLYAVASNVSVDVSFDGVAHVSGCARCGSSWSCCICAPVIREQRAIEVDNGLGEHLAGGGFAMFVTFTCEHHDGDALAPRLQLMSNALGQVFRGSAWERYRARLAYCGSIRAIEITHGGNGWHPHNHALLLFDTEPTEADWSRFEAWMLGRWSAIVERLGFGWVSPDHGIVSRPVTTAPEIANYVTKIDGGWSAGHEVARGDNKRKGTTPFDLLRSFATTGDLDALDLWQEYERATFGKRSLFWSHGLRERLLGGTEATDEELAAAEGAGLTVVRALIERQPWDEQVKRGRSGRTLAEIEHVAMALLRTAELMGHTVQPLDDPREGQP